MKKVFIILFFVAMILFDACTVGSSNKGAGDPLKGLNVEGHLQMDTLMVDTIVNK